MQDTKLAPLEASFPCSRKVEIGDLQVPVREIAALAGVTERTSTATAP